MKIWFEFLLLLACMRLGSAVQPLRKSLNYRFSQQRVMDTPPRMGVELETGGAWMYALNDADDSKITLMTAGIGKAFEDISVAKTTGSVGTYNLLNLALDHNEESNTRGIIEIVSAPHNVEYVPTMTLYVALSLVTKALTTISTQCPNPKSIPLNGAPQRFTKMSAVITEYNRLLTDTAADPLMAVLPSLGDYELHYEDPKAHATWWVVCGWVYDDRDAYMNGIQINYGLPVARVGNPEWVSTMFKKVSASGASHEADDDVMRPNEAKFLAEAQHLITIIDPATHLPPAERANVIGTLVILMHYAVARARSDTRAAVKLANMAGGPLKNQQHQLMKVCLNDLVRKLSTDSQNALKAWWQGGHRDQEIIDALSPLALDSDLANNDTQDETGGANEAFQPQRGSVYFRQQAQWWLGNAGTMAFIDPQKATDAGTCAGTNVKLVPPIDVNGALAVVVESRVADPLRKLLSPQKIITNPAKWAGYFLSYVSVAVDTMTKAVSGDPGNTSAARGAVWATFFADCSDVNDDLPRGADAQAFCEAKADCQYATQTLIKVCKSRQ